MASFSARDRTSLSGDDKPLGGQTLARCVEEIVSVLAIVLSGCSQEAGTQWFLI